tara:strand:- start:91 stop:666 length:576 start_codon:yes stop_codon:yes gene_type:complete
MKKFLQFFLFFFVIIIAIIFYINYFTTTDKLITSKSEKRNEISSENKNNVIKNLKYEVKFDDKSEYNITSDLSEITYVDGSETVLMSGVSAKFNDGNNPSIYVTSDKAIFNNNNFNTRFENNVKVTYMENIITSKNLDLDFDKNTIFIYNNVIYDGLTGAAKTDNIVIDLLTKNAEIFMNKPTQKVKVISK